MMFEGDSDVEDEPKGKKAATDETDAADVKGPLQEAGSTIGRVASIPDHHHHQEEKRSASIIETKVRHEESSTEQLLREAVSDSLLDDGEERAAMSAQARAARALAFVKESMQEVADMEHFVSVTNPVLHESSIQSYITYDVTSKHGTVQRRFREFVWLHNMLEQMCPGMIVPRLPDKQALGRFDQQFIERRRHELERFLRYIAAHPDLSRSGPFLEFCTTASSLDTGDMVPNTGLETVGRLLLSLNTAAAALVASDGPRPKGDVWFEEKAKQVESLESCLSRLLKALDAIREDYRELANAGVQLGTSARSEAMSEHDGGLRAALDNLAATEDRLRALHADPESHYVEPLAMVVREYQGMAQALLKLFSKRDKLVDDVYSSKQNLARSQAAAERKYEGPEAEYHKAQAERDAVQAKEKSEELRKRLSELSSTIRKECARFDKDRQRDLAVATVQFARDAVRYQEKVVHVWEASVAKNERAASAAAATEP